MSSIGTGYDLSCTTFSPDGRVFQVEYATKAVDNSGTAIGLRVRDGVVLGVEKLILSKMLVEGSNRRVLTVDENIGVAFAGLSADARMLVKRCRTEASGYRDFYGSPIPTHVLSDRISGYVQAHTLYAHLRPFGCALLIAGYDAKGPQLFAVEPSGLSWGFYGCAIGKGKQACKTEIEKLRLSAMTCREAIVEVARIIQLAHDDSKEKTYELDLSWVCDESNHMHQAVPAALKAEAIAKAKQAVEEAMGE
ncbi:20S proteasome regulatory subunit alpha protein [Pelomyxa schiedti]|nr:20S proteasome regulatory subunit alpha protein [Pelomyxa schiedti]